MKLVFLIYASNNCYVKVTRKMPKEVIVDFKKRVWRYEKREYSIGNDMRHCERSARYGVIGVYDINEIAHIDSMVHHAIEATRDYKLDLC